VTHTASEEKAAAADFRFARLVLLKPAASTAVIMFSTELLLVRVIPLHETKDQGALSGAECSNKHRSLLSKLPGFHSSCG
jgi:hypothetical protein